MGNKGKESAWEQQEKQKLEEIYRVHGNMMMQTAMSVLHHREDAEDAVQNSILSMARHMHAVGEVQDFRTISYVRTVVRNTAIDIYREKKRGDASFEELLIEPESSFDLEHLVCNSQEVEHIVAVIAKMDISYREVLSLFYLNELSPKEIADVLQSHITRSALRLIVGKRYCIGCCNMPIRREGCVMRKRDQMIRDAFAVYQAAEEKEYRQKDQKQEEFYTEGFEDKIYQCIQNLPIQNPWAKAHKIWLVF